jgi:uncharacterized membrane protein (DUF106 family)
MAANVENKGIFIKTIELIGSIIALMLFTTILFGIFTSSLDAMLWKLFDWIVEILKPIVSILLLLVGVFRGLPLLVSFFESLLEDRRIEREEINLWQNISSPTPMNSSQNLSQNTPTKQKESAPIGGVGEDVIVTEHTDNGGIFHHVKKGSKEYQDVIKKNAERQRAEEKKDVEKMYSEQNGNPILQRLARMEK